MSRICIKGISKNTSEKGLKDIFSNKGEVTDVRIVKTKDGKSRQLAFVGFRTDVQAQEAIQYYHNTYIDTSKVIVELAKRYTDDVNSNSDGIRSKHTKKKIELNKLKSEELQIRNDNENKKKISGEKQLKAENQEKVLSAKEIRNAKEKADFLQAMKPRKDSKFWTNDESLPADATDVMDAVDTNSYTSDDNENNVHDTDSDSDSDSDSDKNKNKNKKSTRDSIGDGNKKKITSDVDFLRSKVVSNFSDDDDGDSDGDKSNRQSRSTKGKGTNDIEEAIDDDDNDDDGNDMQEEAEVDDGLDDTGRLFIRNLPFGVTEEEVTTLFEAYGTITEVHLPIDAEKKKKGFGFVQFMLPEQAERAKNSLDGHPFQGRLLHIIVSKRVKDVELQQSNRGNSRLSSYQQKKEDDRRKMLNKKEGWNASFVRSDTVVDTLAHKYGVSKADILDTTEGSGEMAVRLALGEAHVIQENKDYFQSHGVDITSLESNKSNTKAVKRSNTTLLVKNLPHDVIDDELKDMFTVYGNLSSFLLPASKSIALIDFDEPTEAKNAFKGLAYRKYKHVPLYLEWAPLNIIDKSKATAGSTGSNKGNAKNANIKSSAAAPATTAAAMASSSDKDYATIYIKNLNFKTNDEALRQHMKKLGCANGLRVISIPMGRIKDKEKVSLGYGFAEFASSYYATEALSKLNRSVLDEHALEVKPSEKRISASSSSSSSSSSGNSGINEGCKLIVRNVAFQATPGELKSLFSSFGSVKRVRIPKKMGGEHRGFAFIDFATNQEATSAMNSLKETHLYGRHLVIEWAKEEQDDDDNIQKLRKRASLDEKSSRLSEGSKVIDAKRRKTDKNSDRTDPDFDYNDQIGSDEEDDD